MSETDEVFLERMETTFGRSSSSVVTLRSADLHRLLALARRGADSSAAERRGMVKGLRMAQAVAKDRVPTHSANQEKAYRMGYDMQGERYHAAHCEAYEIGTLIEARASQIEQETSSEDNR